MQHIESIPPEDATLLLRLRPVLRMVGKKCKYPGFLDAHAIDSIGKCLDLNSPETHRLLLMGDPNGADAPSCRLHRRTFKSIFVDELHDLGAAAQALCIPLRGRDEVAIRLDAEDRVLGSVVVTFKSGATLTLRQQQATPLGVMLLINPVDDRPPIVMEAVLDAMHGVALNKLFTPTTVASASTPPTHVEPVIAKHVKYEHELPVWLTEHMRTLGQDLFRLHVLATAAAPQGSHRQFYLDVAKALLPS